MTPANPPAPARKQRTIHLPIGGLTIHLTGDGGGSLESDLHEEIDRALHELDATDDARIDWEKYARGVDAVESLVLAHAGAGVDIEDPRYIEGIETALASLANQEI